MDRKTILLQAARDMLKKCIESPFVIGPQETNVRYDDADCDGYCLLEDIENELESEESRIKELESYNALMRELLREALPTIDGDMADAWRTGLKQRISDCLKLPNVKPSDDHI